MSKNFSKLLVMSLATCATAFSATGRGVDTNLSNVKFKEFNSSAYSLTGGKMGLMTENKDREDSFGGCLSVTGFWEQSINGERGSKKLAQGYGVDGLNSFDVTYSAADVDTETVLTTGQVDSRRLIHQYDNTTAGSWASATMALEAKHRRYGANIEYSQCLSNFYEGLKFRVSTAVVGVKNELVAEYTSEVPDSSSAITVKKFFQGDFTATAAGANSEAPLTKGKFGASSQTHVALNDINAYLGLDVVSTDSAGVCLGISGVIPAGRDLTGEFVMEPQVGNRHFRLGLEGAVHACLAEGADYKVGFATCAQWHYAFARDAVRLPSHTGQNYGQYWSGYKTGSVTGSALEPVMNFLVPGGNNVNVKPEHQFNMTSLLSFEKSCFCAEAGYNLTYAQAEKNTSLIKESDVFVVAGKFNNTNAKDGVALSTSLVSFNNAAQLNHNLFGSVGFSGKDWQYPVAVNLIGGYELAGERKNNREVWHVSLKGSFCF